VVTFRERLTASKQRILEFHVGRINLKELNKGKKLYCAKFTAVENDDAEVDVNRAWETIGIYGALFKETLGYYELKKHEPWVDEGCSELSN
jgi:hypothetical protein